MPSLRSFRIPRSKENPATETSAFAIFLRTRLRTRLLPDISLLYTKDESAFAMTTSASTFCPLAKTIPVALPFTVLI